MNLPLVIGLTALVVVAFGIAIEVARMRASQARKVRAAGAPPRRVPHLEKSIAAAFEGPHSAYGQVFASFSVWRQHETTRMDIETAPPWKALNSFTRSLIVRHLWQSLQKLSKSQVVIYVDEGAPGTMTWNAKANAAFDDRGVRPPWMPATGRAGTLISGA